jgi:pentatricopeptide repeat protein
VRRKKAQEMALQNLLNRTSQTLMREMPSLGYVMTRNNNNASRPRGNSKSRAKTTTDLAQHSVVSRDEKIAHRVNSQHEKLDEKRKSLKNQLSLNLRQLRDVDKEIDRAMSRRRSAREEKQYDVADRMMQKLPVLASRKNDLSQFKLKTIGKEFGDLLVQRASLVNSEESMKSLQSDFLEYCTHYQPKIFHYNMLLRGFENSGLAEDAEALIEEMKSREIRPDGRSISSMISVWREVKRVDKVISWINNARRRKIADKIDSSALDKALHFIVECGEISRADSILKWLPASSNLKLSPRTIVSLLSIEYSEWKVEFVDRISLILNFMDAESFSSALSFCSSKGYVDACVLLLQEMNYRKINHSMDELDFKLLKISLQASNQLHVLQNLSNK